MKVCLSSVLSAALLPFLTEAFIHHPGMYGYGNSYSSSSTTYTEPKTQAEKLQDPWLWVCVVLFSICMVWCLNTSFKGKWMKVCGDEENPDNQSSLLGRDGGGVRRSGNIHGFR